jgi:predicted outer membrane lipoprotein
MPILMLGLIALTAFGIIGILLLTAVIMESRKKKKETEASHLDATAVRGGKRMA